MLGQCWASVYDAGPTLIQHCIAVSGLLGNHSCTIAQPSTPVSQPCPLGIDKRRWANTLDNGPTLCRRSCTAPRHPCPSLWINYPRGRNKSDTTGAILDPRLPGPRHRWIPMPSPLWANVAHAGPSLRHRYPSVTRLAGQSRQTLPKAAPSEAGHKWSL